MTHKVLNSCKSKTNVMYTKNHEGNKLSHKAILVLTKRKAQRRVLKSTGLAAVPPPPPRLVFRNSYYIFWVCIVSLNVSDNHYIPQTGRCISRNVASLNTFVHDMINPL